MIIHEYDRPTDIAVLVTGKAPHYYIAGWIPVAMAQRPKYRHSKQPNWWVSQINLQPIEEFEEIDLWKHCNLNVAGARR